MSLPPPQPGLRASVVVPANNEEALVGGCLEALAEQERIAPEEYEVLLVLDRCTDGTEQVARGVADAHPGLRLHLLEGPGQGSGPARRLGMDAACERLFTVGRPGGLIASTDADTMVARNWLSAQLEAVSRGARAVGGRIELADEGSLPDDVLRRHAEQGRLRHLNILSDPAQSGRTEHWQFSGASLSLTAELYREVGGLEPRASLEDEHLERLLIRQGVPIHRLLSVRARTSSRLTGRAEHGLANDLAQLAVGDHHPATPERGA